MSSDSSENDIELNESQVFNAIRSILIKNNELNRMRAELRTRVIQILHEHEPTVNQLPNFGGSVDKNRVQKFVIAMMSEYLNWCGYKYSAEVLAMESGQPSGMYEEENWCKLFSINRSDESMPLLAEMAIDKLIAEEMKLEGTTHTGQ